jgi:hypothetical protein
VKQINEYQTFRDIGLKNNVRAPEGYKKIRVHLIYDVKHDGRFKARLVADGLLTDHLILSIHSQEFSQFEDSGLLRFLQN